MKTLTINLTAPLKEELNISGRVAAVNRTSIERLLNKVKEKVNKWLLFGEADMDVMLNDTGEIVASGKYEYNIFAGRGNYEIKFAA